MNTGRRRELNKERGKALLPELWAELEPVLDCLEEDGWYPLIAQGYRSIEEQGAIYAQGRESLDVVNSLRKAAGLNPIDNKENKLTVTKAKAGKSLHNFRRAVDLVQYRDGQPADWNNKEFYEAAWYYLEALGWKWGNHFKSFKDIPHFEK